jgi:type III secretion protein D
MLELRILSGLNRGAAMTIEDTHTLKIGSAEDSDVLILDYGIADNHLTLEYQDGELVLTPIDEVRSQDGSYITEPIIVERLHCFYLKGIWIGIAEESDDWSIFDTLPTSLPDASLSLLQENEQYHIEPIKMSWKSKVFAIGGLLMLASWATASVFLPRDSALKNIDNTKLVNQNTTENSPPNEIKKVIVKKYYSREDLANILDSKLMELQLRKLLDIKTDVEGWNIEGSLDDEDRLRLERAVEAFNSQYKPRFPINIRMHNLSNFLPFKITQIMSGKMAGVTTEDGQRFFVGDTIDGYRLVSVLGNKATFDGKRKIEIIL